RQRRAAGHAAGRHGERCAQGACHGDHRRAGANQARPLRRRRVLPVVLGKHRHSHHDPHDGDRAAGGFGAGRRRHRRRLGSGPRGVRVPQQGGGAAGGGAGGAPHDPEATGSVSIQSPSIVSGMVWWEVGRDAVWVAGADAEAYLQGQCSADVAALGGGESAWTFLLQPSGKVDVLARVTRRPDGFVVDTDGGFGTVLVERLRRFLLRTKATVEPLAWRGLAVRPPGPRLVTMGAELIVRADWHGQPGFDILASTVEPPPGATPLPPP